MDKWLDGWGMGEKGRQRGEFRNKWVDEWMAHTHQMSLVQYLRIRLWSKTIRFKSSKELCVLDQVTTSLWASDDFPSKREITAPTT